MALDDFLSGFLNGNIIVDIRPPDDIYEYYINVKTVGDFLDGVANCNAYTGEKFYNYITRGYLQWTHLAYNTISRQCVLCRRNSGYITSSEAAVTIKELNEIIVSGADAEPLSDLVDQVFA